MLKRLFNNSNNGKPELPATLTDFHYWLSCLPAQDKVGVPNSEQDNVVVSWFRNKNRDDTTWHDFRFHQGAIYYKDYWDVTRSAAGEPWMGKIVTLNNLHQEKTITAATALEDTDKVIAELTAQQLAPQLVNGTLPAPAIGSKHQEQGAHTLKLVCAYCQRAIPNTVARQVTDVKKETTSQQSSSASNMRLIEFTCPFCSMQNALQMDMRGQVTIKEETAILPE